MRRFFWSVTFRSQDENTDKKKFRISKFSSCSKHELCLSGNRNELIGRLFENSKMLFTQKSTYSIKYWRSSFLKQFFGAAFNQARRLFKASVSFLSGFHYYFFSFHYISLFFVFYYFNISLFLIRVVYHQYENLIPEDYEWNCQFLFAFLWCILTICMVSRCSFRQKEENEKHKAHRR